MNETKRFTTKFSCTSYQRYVFNLHTIVTTNSFTARFGRQVFSEQSKITVRSWVSDNGLAIVRVYRRLQVLLEFPKIASIPSLLDRETLHQRAACGCLSTRVGQHQGRLWSYTFVPSFKFTDDFLSFGHLKEYLNYLSSNESANDSALSRGAFENRVRRQD